MTPSLVGLAMGSAIPLCAWLTFDAMPSAPPLRVVIPIAALVVLISNKRLQTFLFIFLCVVGFARARGAIIEVMSAYTDCISVSSAVEGESVFTARVDDVSNAFGESPSIVVSVLAWSESIEREFVLPDVPIATEIPTGDAVSRQAPETGPVRMRLLVYLDGNAAMPSGCRGAGVLEGDVVEIQGAIARIEGPKCFGAANPRSIYLPQRIVGVVSRGKILSTARVPIEEQSLWWRLRHAVCSLRVTMAQAVKDRLPKAEAGMVMSAFLGMKGTLPDPVDDHIRRAGISHLLSVSGMHVGMIAAGIVLILGALINDPAKARVCTVPVLCLYAMLAGLRVSVLRAVLMFGLAALSRAGSLGWSSRKAAELVALALLLVDPLQLAQVSFQLSFAATYGIIALSSFGSDVRHSDHSPAFSARIGRSLKSMAVVYLGAQIGVAPLSVLHFRSFSLVGGPATALASPLLAFGSVLSLAGAGLDAAGLGFAAMPCMHLSRWLLGALVSGAALLGDLPFSCVDFSCAWSRAVGCMAMSAWGIVLTAQRDSFTRTGKASPGAFCAAGLISCVAILAVVMTQWSSWARLELYFLSVGQGDCAVCVAPGGRTIVIDAGPKFEGEDYTYDAGESVLIPFLKWRGVQHVDLFILTHLHSDHFGGLPALIERGLVSVVCSSSVDGLGDLLDGVSGRLPLFVELLAGDVIRIGDEVTVSVIWPKESVARDTAGDENARSVVVELNYRSFDALMTGDIGAGEETAILNSCGATQGSAYLFDAGRLRQASDQVQPASNQVQLFSDQVQPASDRLEVLKVPHHGSQNSSSSALLRSTSPWLSVISVGSNRYGHPSQAALTRLTRYSQVVVRTDQDKSVKVWTDGQRFSAVTSCGCLLVQDLPMQ